jgi:hypothetical protein
MTVAGVLKRFTIAYIVLMFAGAILAAGLGVKLGSSLNTALLLGSITWACMSFGQKNGRYFTPEEKSRTVRGMILVDLTLQALMGSLALLGPGKLSAGLFLGALAFVVILHAVVIYFFVGIVGKMVAKQQEKTAWADTVRGR